MVFCENEICGRCGGKVEAGFSKAVHECEKVRALKKNVKGSM